MEWNKLSVRDAQSKDPSTMSEKLRRPKNESKDANSASELDYPSKSNWNNVRHLIDLCGNAISENDVATAEKMITYLKGEVSVFGDPMQRLGAYMVEALIAKLGCTGWKICKRCKELKPCSLNHVRDAVFPCFKFGYVAANGAIAEAVKGHDRVHIIDFSVSDNGSQWVSLIKAFAAREGSAPHICITSVVDPSSEKGGVESVGKRLSSLAETCKVPFEFHGMSMFDLGGVNCDGEALAVNFAFGVTSIVGDENTKDGILRMVKGLGPKVVTLVEDELGGDGGSFSSRLSNALSYYSAIFEALDVLLPRDSRERVNVEEFWLGGDLVKVIACQGDERVGCRLNLMRTGFRPFPLNSDVNSTIRTLLGYYSENYRLVENNNIAYLGWLDRPLVSASAWH